MIPVYFSPPVLVYESVGSILTGLLFILVVALVLDRAMFGTFLWR